jgi:hypothetical protein
MAPPKKFEAIQTTIKTRVHTRSRVHVEEGEQQPLEIVNVKKLPSLDIAPVNPIPILEETQHPKTEGTNIDIPEEIQEPQN